MKKDALIVVDVQNDFLPGGALAVPDGNAVIEPINALMKAFDLVVMTQDWHPKGHVSFASSHTDKNVFESVELDYGRQVLWPDHCVAGTHGADFAETLDAERAVAIIRKGTNKRVDSYSGFVEADGASVTGLSGLLKSLGVTRVWVCGLATDYCVASTAIDAAKAGFETRVVMDACRGIDVDGSLEVARNNWQKVNVMETTVAETIATK